MFSTFSHEVYPASLKVDGTTLPVKKSQFIACSSIPVQFLPDFFRIHLLHHLHLVNAALETGAEHTLQLCAYQRKGTMTMWSRKHCWMQRSYAYIHLLKIIPTKQIPLFSSLKQDFFLFNNAITVNVTYYSHEIMKQGSNRFCSQHCEWKDTL